MSKNVWMVRAGEDAYLVDDFEKGFVAIGWNDVGDLSKVKTLETIKGLYAEKRPNEKPGKVASAAGMLHKFSNVIKEDDFVITYDPIKREYLIGVVLSDYYYKEGEIRDYAHVRRVTWQRRVSRDALKPQSRNSLGSISTLFTVTPEAWDDIQRALGEAKESGSGAAEIEKTDFDEIKRSKVQDAHELIKDKLLELDEYEMQDLVAAILRAMGYKTRVSARGPDRGKDIFASPDGLGFEEPRIKVEVKHRRNTPMSAPDVRTFAGGLRPGDRGLYVSTGGFSKEARYEAERSNIPITLVDIDGLADLLISNYETLDLEGRALVPLTRVYLPSE